MQSMTGYGRKVVQDEVYSIVAEVAAVNRKNLEVALSAPKEWFNLDRIAVELAKKRFARGRLQLQVKIERLGGKNPNQSWDVGLIGEKLEEFKTLCETVGASCQVDENLVLNLLRVSGSESQLPDWEDYGDKVIEAIEGAMDDLGKMRGQEGDALSEDLSDRLSILSGIAEKIETLAPDVGPAHRKALLERLEQAEINVSVDDDRIIKEIALFVDRSDVSEEITRLKSHFDQLGKTILMKGAIGRKIDFILQEIFREFNTIGSKANLIDISQLVIEGKNELERFREQAQNIE